MRKIQKGLIYDTEKAEKICHIEIKNNFRETLYLTKRGRFFIVKRDLSIGTREIYETLRELVPTDAIDWIEEHREAPTIDEDGIYEKYFSDHIQEA